MVEDLLAPLESLATMDGLHVETAVEAHVTVVLENGVIHRFDNAGLLGGPRQLDVVELHLLAEQQPAFGFGGLVGELLAARLNGEVSLPQSDDFFTGVGVLHNQVAGVSRKKIAWTGRIVPLCRFRSFR